MVGASSGEGWRTGHSDVPSTEELGVRVKRGEVVAVVFELVLAWPGFPIGEGTWTPMPGGRETIDLVGAMFLSELLPGEGGSELAYVPFRI